MNNVQFGSYKVFFRRLITGEDFPRIATQTHQLYANNIWKKSEGWLLETAYHTNDHHTLLVPIKLTPT